MSCFRAKVVSCGWHNYLRRHANWLITHILFRKIQWNVRQLWTILTSESLKQQVTRVTLGRNRKTFGRLPIPVVKVVTAVIAMIDRRRRWSRWRRDVGWGRRDTLGIYCRHDSILLTVCVVIRFGRGVVVNCVDDRDTRNWFIRRRDYRLIAVVWQTASLTTGLTAMIVLLLSLLEASLEHLQPLFLSHDPWLLHADRQTLLKSVGFKIREDRDVKD